jgi:uncharacterized protein YjiS (DUF1127 family)
LKREEPTMTATVITLHRPLLRRLLDGLLSMRLRRSSPLHGLDRRALADIGVHPSEIDSIEAEAHGPRTAVTRRRIVVARA